jgi:hypothetical protein
MILASLLLFLLTFNPLSLIFGGLATSTAVARFRVGVRI